MLRRTRSETENLLLLIVDRWPVDLITKEDLLKALDGDCPRLAKMQSPMVFAPLVIQSSRTQRRVNLLGGMRSSHRCFGISRVGKCFFHEGSGDD